MMSLDAVVNAASAKKIGGAFMAKCPVHDDTTASVSIDEGHDGRVVVFCHSCGKSATEAIVEAWGLTLGDLCGSDRQFMPGANGKATTALCKSDFVKAAYPYCGENGDVIFEAVRTAKGKRMRRPFRGSYAWGVTAGTYRQRNGGDWSKIRNDETRTSDDVDLEAVRLVLYGMPGLIAAPADAFVYVVEGEKDADRLNGHGMIATSCPMGAGKWSRIDDAPLHGHHVIVLADNDRAGRRHADEVAMSLSGKAESVRIVNLPGLPDKGDVSDWLDAGHDPAELDELAVQATEWTVEAPPAKPVFRDIAEVETEISENAEKIAVSRQNCNEVSIWLAEFFDREGEKLLAAKYDYPVAYLAKRLGYRREYLYPLADIGRVRRECRALPYTPDVSDRALLPAVRLIRAGRTPEIPATIQAAHGLFRAKVTAAEQCMRTPPRAIAPSDTAAVVDGMLGVQQPKTPQNRLGATGKVVRQCLTPNRTCDMQAVDGFVQMVAELVDAAAVIPEVPQAVAEALSMLDELTSNWGSTT